MPPRSVKMKRRIFGFQRRVWWPKWTPASKSSRMLTTDMNPLSVGGRFAGGPVWNRRRPRRRHRHPDDPAGSEWQKRLHSSGKRTEPAYSEGMEAALERLAAEIRDASWDLALAYIDEGIRDDTVPSLQRLGQVGQLGDVPTFIVELSKELADPQPARLRQGGPLATRVRDHAREREALGFAPREIVTELLILRRVIWKFVSARADEFTGVEVLEAERRLNDSLDQLVAECVVAYFDRATAELAEQARRDALTGLLNHAAFGSAVDEE